MFRRVYLRSLFAAALTLSGPALAAAPIASTGAEAIILKPLSLLKFEDLDFGALYPSATAGTAILNPSTGVVTTTGGVLFATGTPTAAAFVGAGTRKAPVLIRLPKNPITLTRSGGTETMTVSTWTTDGPTTRHINAFEAFEFKVGGTLNIGPNQADGTYVGTFDVTVVYP
jgi:hypothetical protein